MPRQRKPKYTLDLSEEDPGTPRLDIRSSPIVAHDAREQDRKADFTILPQSASGSPANLSAPSHESIAASQVDLPSSHRAEAFENEQSGEHANTAPVVSLTQSSTSFSLPTCCDVDELFVSFKPLRAKSVDVVPTSISLGAAKGSQSQNPRVSLAPPLRQLLVSADEVDLEMQRNLQTMCNVPCSISATAENILAEPDIIAGDPNKSVTALATISRSSIPKDVSESTTSRGMANCVVVDNTELSPTSMSSISGQSCGTPDQASQDTVTDPQYDLKQTISQSMTRSTVGGQSSKAADQLNREDDVNALDSRSQFHRTPIREFLIPLEPESESQTSPCTGRKNLAEWPIHTAQAGNWPRLPNSMPGARPRWRRELQRSLSFKSKSHRVNAYQPPAGRNKLDFGMGYKKSIIKPKNDISVDMSTTIWPVYHLWEPCESRKARAPAAYDSSSSDTLAGSLILHEDVTSQTDQASDSPSDLDICCMMISPGHFTVVDQD